MFHLPEMTGVRISDLYATASELRSARNAPAGTSVLRTLRVGMGVALLAAGTALVSGANPAATTRVAR